MAGTSPAERRAAPRAMLAAALLLGTAALPARAAEDPFEAVNRQTHRFNRAVQAHLLGPLVEAYHAATTPRIRRGVRNVFANLREPVTALSGLAGGEAGIAWNAAARFGINST